MHLGWPQFLVVAWGACSLADAASRGRERMVRRGIGLAVLSALLWSGGFFGGTS